MLVAVVLTLILIAIILAVGSVVVRNAIQASYRQGFQEAKALYNVGQAESWALGAEETLRWINAGLPSAEKPNNPFKH